jgi:AcrR family transcriptional regulator
VPRLWSETIDTHRREVREAILETTAALVAQHGLAAVTMSQIAENTGIGRATLYKYFPDVEAILMEWHQRHVNHHLEQLVQVREKADDAAKRLETVLDAYARLRFERPHDTELAALVHRGEHITRAEQHVSELIRDVLGEAVATGDVRDDIPPDELASYCINALAAARSLSSKAAVRRLVMVTLAGLRPAT